MMRLRITFSKTGSLRYTGHLDLQTVWERTARRAGLPLAYTQGFHPGPRIQIASALPLGFIGHAEIPRSPLR
jgi:radical SAM-linked protein